MASSLFFVGAFSVITLLTILYLKVGLAWPGKPNKRHKAFSDLRVIHQILSPVPSSSRHSLLQSRAVANYRLIHAFGLTTSTFTSASTDINHAFRKQASIRIKSINSIDDWKTVGDQVLLICRHFLCKEPNYRHDYDDFIQAIVFMAVLFVFFQVPFDNVILDTLDFAEVSGVTNKINKLWIASKSPGFDATPNSILPDLQGFLQKWIDPDIDNPFAKNPLEIIIPAYETMWRVVAHAYVRIEPDPQHIKTFLAYAENPTVVQFKTLDDDNNAGSAENIIQETLRLYPPTKRIKRALLLSKTRQFFASMGFGCFAGREIISADIEGLHTSSIWNPSPHDFDALRHRNLTEAQKLSFLPFGYGPLKCIAVEFAPRFSAIILGSLLKIEDVVLTRGEIHGEREGWNGWKIQSNYKFESTY